MFGLRHVVTVVNCIVVEVAHFGSMGLLLLDAPANGASELNARVLLQRRHTYTHTHTQLVHRIVIEMHVHLSNIYIT